MLRDNGLLDEINRRLLAELSREPRMAMSALARRVKMSAPAVTERVQRLERAGVITGYRLEVAPAALGLPVTAFARIRPAAGQLSKVAELAGSLPQVTECHRITGEDCFLIKVDAQQRSSSKPCLINPWSTGRPSRPSWSVVRFSRWLTNEIEAD